MINIDISAIQHRENSKHRHPVTVSQEQLANQDSQESVIYSNPFKKLLSKNSKSVFVHDNQANPPKYNIRITANDITYVDRHTPTKHIIVLNFETGEIVDNNQAQSAVFRDTFLEHLKIISEDILKKKADVFEEI